MHRSFFEKRAGKKSHTPEKKICQNCGHVNQGTALFCAECGTKLLAEPVTTQAPMTAVPQKRKSGKVFVVAALAVVIVVAGAIGISWSSKTAYTAAVNQAQTAMEERNYTAAIDSLKIAVEKKPRNPEAYRMLATAYTENQELYEAREILKTGYQKTKDESLKKVSIWGPMSMADILCWYFINEGPYTMMPITHMEYVFEGDSVTGYQSIAMSNQREMRYCFNEKGEVDCTEIGAVQPIFSFFSDSFSSFVPSFSFGSGELKLLDWESGYEWLACGDFRGSEKLNYTYDALGRVSSVEFEYAPGDKEMVAEFTYYGNGLYCDNAKLFDGEANAYFKYDGFSRITEINVVGMYDDYYDWQSVFQYHKDGGWDVTNVGKTYQISFDSTGRVLSMECPEWPEQLENTWNENGCVTKTKWTIGDSVYTYKYSYLENGKLDKMNCYAKDGIEGTNSSVTATCTYSQDNFLTGIDYKAEGSAIQPVSAHRDILYLEDGKDIRIFKMVQQSDDVDWLNWESRYFYDDDNVLDAYNVTDCDGDITRYETYVDEYGALKVE